MNRVTLLISALVLLTLALSGTALGKGRDEMNHNMQNDQQPATTLYVWAGDQARVAPDFLAVINFDETSNDYGKVIGTVPIPPPGNVDNEAHHCHLSADHNILACGGLLSFMHGQNSIFFFDVSDARNPKFLFSTKAPQSSATDAFLPLDDGGFLVTQMGSATGDAPGRVAEFDAGLNLIKEWPDNPDLEFNPHGISARPELNLMVTSDFILPSSTLNSDPRPLPQVRSAVRVWDFQNRKIVRTVQIHSARAPKDLVPFPPGTVGTMDVILIPGDPKGRAFTVGMFDGFVYLVDTKAGTAKAVFDCNTIVPHIAVQGGVIGGMAQLLEMTPSGDRLLFGLFQAGEVGMLDVSNPEHPVQVGIAELGPNAGPHMLMLTHDDQRLVVSDYFLNEDGFGKVDLEGDHHVHVFKVSENGLQLDPRFDVDFNSAFPTGPARPHGFDMK
jgi:selenium-binding protein 1